MSSIGDVHTGNANIFAGDGHTDNISINDPRPPADALYGPIRVAQIIFEVGSGATGSDDIRLDEVKRISAVRPALLFNAMLLYKTIPPNMRTCRTTLISKTTNDLHLVREILHCILAERLSALPLHFAQREY